MTPKEITPIKHVCPAQPDGLTKDQKIRALAVQVAAASTEPTLPARNFAQWAGVLEGYIRTGEWSL